MTRNLGEQVRKVTQWLDGTPAVVRSGGDAADGASVHEPAANTLATVTITAPGAGYRTRILAITAYYTGGAPAVPSRLDVESPDGTDIWADLVSGENTLTRILVPVLGAENAAIVIELPVGGTLVSGHLFVLSQKEKVVTV